VWTFQPGVGGEGSYVERRPEGPGAPAPTRFAVGSLTACGVRAAGTPARPSVTARLTMKQAEDQTPAEFLETFVVHNQIADPRWNPLER
jgi:hypothetical protein